MLGKYFLGFLPTSVIYLASWMLVMLQFLCHVATRCPPPDFPEGGKYEPIEAEYAVGKLITYSCNDIVPMRGRNKTACLSSGKWSGNTPFCETPTNLKNPFISAVESSRIYTAIDGNISTCFQTRNDTEEFLVFSLDHEAIVDMGILCFGEGKATVKITVYEFWTDLLNVDIGMPIVRCFFISFKKYGATKSAIVQILSDSSPVFLCEVKFFSIDNKWCEEPPKNSFPNGQLEVGRSKAVLHCKEGFRVNDDTRVVATCQNNIWSYQSLFCVEEESQEDNSALDIVIAAVVITLILILFGLTIFLIRTERIRGICVICKPGNVNNCSASPNTGDPSTTDVCNIENSTV
ncbi:unnamed protein product [Larinioides sclopetarius]|uniref:Sushi domain-containing protein n=1 Tax=Larinioides sclopetarius TaxID=280406 RepID=A0AAV2B1C5_9ARAC